ncbi:MAG: hypothetical protein ACOC1K_05070 [Nanoarchaeota archaeon]
MRWLIYKSPLDVGKKVMRLYEGDDPEKIMEQNPEYEFIDLAESVERNSN